jgi:phospholipid/cholesterol/gamma-HCH transport system substrate-binding protein
MQGRWNATRVGVFVVAGLALFAVGLFLIGDRRLLFVPYLEIETAFTKVTGLQIGTRVRVSGMNAGEVLAIDVPPRPSEPFVVRLRVRRDLAHLIRTDSVAAIQTDGIVGNAFVQIGPGTDGAAPVSAGSRIRGTDPIELADVVAQATQTLAAFRTTVEHVSDSVEHTLNRLTVTIEGVNGVMDEVETGVKSVTQASTRTIEEVERTISETRHVVQSIRAGEGTLGKLVTDDALYTDLRAATHRTVESLENVQATTLRARHAVDRLFAPGGATDGLIGDLRSAAGAAEELLADLAENTEALKRNWLVRGFFRRRGFYDINALTPLEYRRFAEDREKRTALRIWIDASVLFTTDEAGEEHLSADGRSRLDQAMGTFLEYRRDSPLVVEGYSIAGTTSAQFLTSDARARLVRDHLVRRFRREASITGAIGLAGDARESPSGAGQWDGVALALHIPR